MAKYRQIHTHIWKDSWFLDLDPKHKLFFIYLFSNERASISGLYELAQKVMVFESGLSQEEIEEAFEIFSAAEKAFYDEGVVWIVNLRKYHETKSPKVQAAIINDISSIRVCKLRGIYCERYGIDIVSDDRVSIPSISSSSSSSSSSKDQPEPEIEPPQPVPNDNGRPDPLTETAVKHLVNWWVQLVGCGKPSDAGEKLFAPAEALLLRLDQDVPEAKDLIKAKRDWMIAEKSWTPKWLSALSPTYWQTLTGLGQRARLTLLARISRCLTE